MKKISKRITAIILSLIIAIAIVPLSGLNIGVSAVSGDDVVAYARTFVGCSYVSGGKGPDSFDCSGFVSYVFAHFGISIPNSTYTIWNNMEDYGTIIDHGTTENAKAGDVIVWVGHVSIYTSDGGCVEALNSRYGVTEALPVNSHTNGMDYYVLRIKGIDDQPTPKPAAPVISADKTTVRRNESLTLSWKSVDGATSYRVECFLGPLPFVDEDVNVTSYTFSLPVTGNYVVSVYAINSSGETQSNELAISVKSTTDVTEDDSTADDPTPADPTPENPQPEDPTPETPAFNLDFLQDIFSAISSLLGYIISFFSSFTNIINI